MKAPLCLDEFEGMECKLVAGHAGLHTAKAAVGTYTWSDPMSFKPEYDEEEHDEEWEDE